MEPFEIFPAVVNWIDPLQSPNHKEFCTVVTLVLISLVYVGKKVYITRRINLNLAGFITCLEEHTDHPVFISLKGKTITQFYFNSYFHGACNQDQGTYSSQAGNQGKKQNCEMFLILFYLKC